MSEKTMDLGGPKMPEGKKYTEELKEFDLNALQNSFVNSYYAEDEWPSDQVYPEKFKDPDFRSAVEDELIKRANCFEDWFTLYGFNFDNSQKSEMVEKKMLESATTFSDWEAVYNYSSNRPKLNEIAMENMIKTAKHKDEWEVLSIINRDSTNSELKKEIIAGLQHSSSEKNPNEYRRFYYHTK